MKKKNNILLAGIVFFFTIIFVSAAGLQSADLTLGETVDADPISFPEIKGWTLVQEYPVYYPESLWDYINGAADAYLSYLFEDLHIAEYKNQQGTIIKAEVYRHKGPEYAFGIYSIERTPEYDFQDYGTQGYSEESLVHYISGKHYVKVTTNSSGEDVQKVVEIIARKVAGVLGDPGPIPEALSLFPQAGQIKNSEKFIADNFLGHNFLSRVFTVEYQVGDEDFTLFLMEKDSKEQCEKIFESYYAFTKQTVDIAEGDHTVRDKYNGTIQMVWKGNKIWGILNTDDPDLGDKYLDLMGR
jgi:hypothetical protein